MIKILKKGKSVIILKYRDLPEPDLIDVLK
jgi:hypothetical protein